MIGNDFGIARLLHHAVLEFFEICREQREAVGGVTEQVGFQ